MTDYSTAQGWRKARCFGAAHIGQRMGMTAFNPHATAVHNSHSGTSKKLTWAHQQTGSEVAGRRPSQSYNVGMLLHRKTKEKRTNKPPKLQLGFIH